MGIDGVFADSPDTAVTSRLSVLAGVEGVVPAVPQVGRATRHLDPQLGRSMTSASAASRRASQRNGTASV